MPVLQRRALDGPTPAGPDAAARRAEPGAAPAVRRAGVALLLLVQYRWPYLPWGWLRLVLGERAAGAAGSLPGLRFARALGSGQGGGFGLVPSLSRQGLMLFFDDEASARACLHGAPVVQRYRERAGESLVALLRATSCRGSWGGQSMSAGAPAPAQAPVAALTRASIRPRHAAAFWRHTPATQAGVRAAAGCRLAVGLGEAPLLRQATFSVWDNVDAMESYARGGAHQVASRGAYAQHWFSESMFVRFEVLQLQGRWQGAVHG